MRFNGLKTWLAGTALAVLAACGGGGGAEGGIGGTGVTAPDVSYGTITGFGSVWVNGVEFATGSATFKVDDKTNATQADLKIGMVVRVDGDISRKSAATITLDDAVKGRVEQVLDSNRIVVMGQVVQIDAQTNLAGYTPAVGDIVDVHGIIAGDGVLAASFIEKKTALAAVPFAVKGIVKNQVGSTFQVGTLTVNYAGAATGDMPAGNWNGRQVDVKGSACAGNPVCGTLTATKVEPAGPSVTNAVNAEVEGVVAAVTTSGFTVNNQSVVTTSATRYEGGTKDDIAAGVKLEAEGAISGGVLTATKVSFRDSVRLEADVASVTAQGTGVRLTLRGLPGVTVDVSSVTALKGVASPAALAVPNHLRISGRASGSAVQATEVELRSAGSDKRIILQGPVSAAVSPQVTILGVAANLGSVSSFQDNSNAPLTLTTFFGRLSSGSIVKLRADLPSGTVPVWSEAEIED